MSKSDWPKSKIIKTHISNLNWSIKNFGLRKGFNIGCMNTEKIRIGESNFSWWAEIVSELTIENIYKDKKVLNVSIMKEKEHYCYGKFTYDVKIDLDHAKPRVFKKMEMLTQHMHKICLGDPYIDEDSMRFRFEIKVYEYDLTGHEIKSMNSNDYKMNILKDLDNLLKFGICSDMEVKVRGKGFQLHKAIMDRSPELPRDLNDSISAELFEEYLNFVYTGVFKREMRKNALEMMKTFAEKLKFDALEIVCEKMLDNIIFD